MQVVLRFLVYSNLLSAGCGLALYATTCLLVGIDLQFQQAVLAFFAPLMLYILLRMRGAEQTQMTTNHQRNQFLLENRQQWLGVFWLAAVLAVVATIAVWVMGGWEVRVVLLSIAAMVASYSWQTVVRKPKALSLRSNAHLKVITVSGVWILMTVILPVAEVLKTADANLVLHLIASALIIIINVSYSEVADEEADKQYGTKTIATSLGVEPVRQICMALTVVVLGLQFFNCVVFGSDWPAFAAIVITGMLLLMILKSRDLPKDEWRFPLLLDGLLVIRCLLLLFMKLIFTP